MIDQVEVKQAISLAISEFRDKHERDLPLSIADAGNIADAIHVALLQREYLAGFDRPRASST
jgi:hypothetical protein